ncbi:MAG: hypothetical protein ACKV2Q_24840 [Planctomycetaceae bacterium]
MPVVRATISTNLPSDPDRKTRTAIREAAIAGAKVHHARHIPRHDQTFAGPKYGYSPRSLAYQDLKKKLGIDNRPLHFSGKTMAELKSSYQISATGTRGAKLRMKCSLLGANTGRVLDVEAINRLLADGRRKHEHPRLMRLLARLKKTGGRLTTGQKHAIARNAEITAISPDELQWIAKTEEDAFALSIKKPDPMRTP